MACILQEKNMFLVWTENFFSFTWKFEKSDIKPGNSIQSSNFRLGGKNEAASFLEMRVDEFGDNLYLCLFNADKCKNTHFAVVVSDGNNSIIHSCIESKNSRNLKVDLLNSYGSHLPSVTEYPITITCTSKDLNECISMSSSDDISSDDSVLLKSLMKLSSDFKKVQELESYSDVILNVGGIKMKAHKMVLQARSAVFYKMFNADLRESAENEVIIPDIGTAAMKLFLKYLYTGRVEKSNFAETAELFYAADKYEILSLRDICKIDLLSLLQVNNACSVFALAIRHCDEELKEKVVKFTRVHFQTVINAKSFTELSKNDMALLMRLCVCEQYKLVKSK